MSEVSQANSNNWLSACSGDITINNLLIPGTHDTMTASCQDRYYRTQALSLEEQLQAGVRFLDIRLRKTLFAAHREWVSDQTVYDIFGTIRQFLLDNSSEFILVRIQNANEAKDDFPDYIQAIKVIPEEYNDILYVWEEADNPNPFWPKLDDVRGKVVPLECAPPVLKANFHAGRIWAANWHNNPLVSLQDLWDGPNIEEKIAEIRANITGSLQNDKRIFLNHLSATNGELGFPDAYAEIINPLSLTLWEEIAKDNKEKGYRGVQIYDFIDAELSHSLWKLNFI